jgi:type I restriction enzyme S subunit
MSWQYIPLGEVVNISDEKIDPTNDSSHYFNYVGLEYVEGSTGRVLQHPTTIGSEIKSIKNVFHRGQILYGKLRPYLNKVYLAQEDGICSTDIFVLDRKDENQNMAYLAYFLRSSIMLNQMVRFTRGDLPRISRNDFLKINIPLPSPDEQERIEGILTEADILLKLRSDADKEMEKLIPALFNEMFGEYLSNHEPQGLIQLGLKADIQGGLQLSSRRDKLPLRKPYLRVANVQRGYLVLDLVKDIGLTITELERTKLQKDDILVVEGNGNPSEIGRAAIWDGSIPDCVHQNHLIRIRCNRKYLHPLYLESVLNSSIGKKYFFLSGNTTSGLVTISTGIVKKCKIPIPPIEQQEMFARKVNDIKHLFSVQSESRDQLDNLLKSLLYQAFTGELTSDVAITKADMPHMDLESIRQPELVDISENGPSISTSQIENEISGKRLIIWPKLSRGQQRTWVVCRILQTYFTVRDVQDALYEHYKVDEDREHIRGTLDVLVALGAIRQLHPPTDSAVRWQCPEQEMDE